MLAIKAMAFWEISISSQQNLPFLKHVKGLCNLIKQSYCLHLNKCKFGIFRCKIPHIYAKCLVNKIFINVGIVLTTSIQAVVCWFSTQLSVFYAATQILIAFTLYVS